MVLLSDILLLALQGIQLLLFPLSLVLHLLPHVLFDDLLMKSLVCILHLLGSLAAVLLARVRPVLQDRLAQLIQMRPLGLLLVVMMDRHQVW